METSTTPRMESADVIDADGFTPLRIKQVIRETSDAVSLVLDVPESSKDRFRYLAGQFVTIRVRIGGAEHRRCYSMSSSPAVEPDLRITVKRDRDGLVSNWINDTVSVGDELHVAPPEGRFVLAATERNVVTFAGGSGITPVFSLVHSALTATARTARLFYANRNLDSVIFREALAELTDTHGGRLEVHHHLDDLDGVVSPQHVADFIASAEAEDGSHADADYYVCGPAPFMDTVERVLLDTGIPKRQVHLERFSVAAIPLPDPAEPAVTEEVTIELGRSTVTAPYRAGNTLLQTARLAGLKAPSSCETGSCGTCMAHVVEGSARMLNNDALDDDEVAEGWVVTCQALPTSRTVRVVYE
ncbi:MULTISPECIES: ferredoxin--NADP reductase [unclassified Mycolicibacterium]|uniref:ferredoxin--NADP reductase n=1 Tax=unclassified Mycolicibacterium TaxID=2636767 RepID=UPI0012DC8F64|nr:MULTISPECIES: ferredoxin--NADP reductase [unclassified Mycolicibacterium]MUL82673.1 ferredoxin--NADP reductase [Mycolicibacterium sp. CBMA 329]MUL89008.1 ferredoxin--NADP reductase [Mycolicibacterium sp. CBMA 331]MUL97575.1 ferredoxin--NADP reductase [Mycolicibacterium sp. CBMA 334]MUM27174.1 ferredoxin--NADP reductase [Mycolicibacterium sp. CBMA 295]MUM38524.1 ferredoxin--NADP reductase [Mycolicibacterium sp. CBMA 247]